MELNPERTRYADYFDWAAGRLDTLFQVSPTLVNGLTLIPPAQLSTRFNYFAAVARFYMDAMIADRPAVSPATAALIDKVSEHWAVTGECVIVTAPDGVRRAVRPDYVYPVFDRYDKDTVERFVFVFPERSNTYATGRRQTTFDGGVPDTVSNRMSFAERARVIDYTVADGTARMSTRDYRAGWVDDTPIGEPVNIGRVLWVDTGDGVFHDMDGIVREITVRLNVLQSALNSVAFPILQADVDSMASGTFVDGVTPDKVTTAVSGGLGLTIPPPFIGEEGARYVERTGTGLDESLNYLRMLLGQLGVISGVPDYVFGVQLGRPANETERVLFTGQAKVNRFRRDLEIALSTPTETLRFVGEPFVTRSERQNSIIQQFESGLISLNEGRAALGRVASTGGNVIQRLLGRGNNGD